MGALHFHTMFTYGVISGVGWEGYELKIDFDVSTSLVTVSGHTWLCRVLSL